MITYENAHLLTQHAYQKRWVYRLWCNGCPFYVGSTKDPAARLPQHLSGGTKDTAEHIRRAKSKGLEVEMRLCDLCREGDQLYIEAIWISKTPHAVNTETYPEKLAEQLIHPRPCVSQGTLDERIETKRWMTDEQRALLTKDSHGNARV